MRWTSRVGSAFDALAMNQVLSRAEISEAPSTRHCDPSQISTQLWLPPWLPLASPLPVVHSGVPTKRPGTPTARQASINRIDSPVHDAYPQAIDCDGLWSGFGRMVGW